MEKPMDILKEFPVRKSKAQKQAFRDTIASYARGLGYETRVEKGSLGSRNLVIGDPEKAKYLLTAHYDTCARMIVPNLITPCNFWSFLGYQLVIALMLILPMGLISGIVGYFTKDPLAGTLTADAVLLLLLWLMLAGPANKSNVNDNSSGVIAVLEIAKALPEREREKVCFVLFDLEELGLIGSASYRKAHKKASNSQLVLNLDCVGEGDYLYLFPTSKLKKDGERMAALEKITGQLGKKSINLRSKGFSVYPSDQANFPYGVGICALKRGKMGLYLGRIHTPRDTVLEETNVNILRAALITLIGGSAAQ